MGVERAINTELPPVKLAVLLSGGGTTLENIFEHMAEQKLNAKVELVVSSKHGVKGIERAQKRGVRTEVVASADYRQEKVTDWDAFSAKLNEVVLSCNPDLVVLAGFMCFYKIPPQLENRVMNIHPALVPAFAGQGMYGDKVHKAVVKRGAKFSGCTVHFVTNEYDAGPIVLQKMCEVSSEDSADDVQKRVFDLECQAYPEAIHLFQQQRLTVKDGLVFIS